MKWIGLSLTDISPFEIFLNRLTVRLPFPFLPVSVFNVSVITVIMILKHANIMFLLLYDVMRCFKAY